MICVAVSSTGIVLMFLDKQEVQGHASELLGGQSEDAVRRSHGHHRLDVLVSGVEQRRRPPRRRRRRRELQCVLIQDMQRQLHGSVHAALESRLTGLAGRQTQAVSLTFLGISTPQIY